SQGSTIMSRGSIEAQGEWMAGRRGSWHAEGRPIRLALVSWQVAGFLGLTVAGAACLFGECPFSAIARARAALVRNAGTVRSVAFAADGTTLAAVGVDDSIVLWDVATGPESSLPPVGPAQVRCVAFSPDNKTLATGSRTTAVALYDRDARQVRALNDKPTA